MKLIKIISLAFLICAISFKSQAQTYPGIPQFGTHTNEDNTGRDLTYFSTSIGDTLGSTTDTVTIIPNGYTKYYTLTLKDSCVLAIKSVATSYVGSHIWITISNGAVSGFVNFLGYSGLASQWTMISGTTKISPTASHLCILEFMCTSTGTWAEILKTQL